MINLRNKNLDTLVENHKNSILSLFNKKKKNKKKLIAINSWIKYNLGDDYSFERILLAKAEELDLIIERLPPIKKRKFPNSIKYIPKVYDGFASGNGEKMYDRQMKVYNAFALIDSTGIKVCPYCNRNFISNLTNDKKRVAQLDHFYPQSKYPFLALSFFNLIPSCQTCNFFKRNSSIEFFNPYSSIVADKELSINVSLLSPRYTVKDSDYEINWKTQNVKLKNNIEIFHLEELYLKHKYYINNIIRVKYLEKGGHMRRIYDQFLKPLGGEMKDYRTIYGIHGFQDDDMLEIPLSKVSRDIWKQFDR